MSRYRRCPDCGHVAPSGDFRRTLYARRRYPFLGWCCPQCRFIPSYHENAPRRAGFAFPFAKKPEETQSK